MSTAEERINPPETPKGKPETSTPCDSLKLVDIRDITEDEWLQWRRCGIGSSDSGAVVGVNEYTSPVEVWHTKLYGYDDEEQENQKMKMGLKLEPIIAERFEQETGLKPQRRNAILQKPDQLHSLATLDYLIPSEDGWGILECKTTWHRDAWKNGPPGSVEIQLQHQLAVTGLQWGYVAALIDGWKFKTWRYERDEELIEDLMTAEQSFWQMVQKEEIPDIDDSEATSKVLDKYYDESYAVVNEEIDNPELAELVQRHGELKEQEKEIEAEVEAVKNQIKAELGPFLESKTTDESKPDKAKVKVQMPDGESTTVTWHKTTRTKKDWSVVEREAPEIAAKAKDPEGIQYRSLRCYH